MTIMVLPVMALLFSACNVDVHKTADGKNKNVQIDTPVGRLHVSEDANAGEAGLPVYPGARLSKEDNDQNHNNANVNIATGFFGLKVVALAYESDDSIDQVKQFYTSKLKRYGNVLECRTGGTQATYNNDSKDDELTCEQRSGENFELKAGSKNNQHIVSIERRAMGCKFTLVYIQMHGKDSTI
jgi:hypothetical protein